MSRTTKTTRNGSWKEEKNYMLHNVCPTNKKRQKILINDNVKDIHVFQTKSKKINILNCPNCKESLIVNVTYDEEPDETQTSMNCDCEAPKRKSKSTSNEVYSKYNSKNTSFVTDSPYATQYLQRVKNEQRPLSPPQFEFLPACQAFQNDDCLFYNCMNVPPLMSIKGTCSHYPPCPLIPSSPYPMNCYQRPNYAPVRHVPIPRLSLQPQYFEAPEKNIEAPYLPKQTSSAILFSGSEYGHHSSTTNGIKRDRSCQYLYTADNCNSVQSFCISKVSSTVLVRDMGCQFQSRFLKEMLISNEIFSESPSFNDDDKSSTAYKDCQTPSFHHYEKVSSKGFETPSFNSHQKDKYPRVSTLSYHPESNLLSSCKQSCSELSVATKHEDLVNEAQYYQRKCPKCFHKRSSTSRKGSRSDTSCIKSSHKKDVTLTTCTGSCSETSCLQSKHKNKLSRRGSCSDGSCSSCELQKVVPLSILKKDDVTMHSTVKKTTGVKWNNLELKELYFIR